MSSTIRSSGRFTARILSAWVGVMAFVPAVMAGQAVYTQTNLVSDGFVPAAFTDSNLINPWGMAYAPGGPFWIANNNSGTSTLYNGDGSIVPLVVTVPGNPTGQVYSSSGFTNSIFIFSGEGGLITGWSGGATANTLVDHSASGAVYKGLAIATGVAGASATKGFGSVSLGSVIYATNFNSGKIEAYGSNLSPVTLPAGAFTDSLLPAGYAPFNIQNINGKLYVTYALQNAAKHDDVKGPGHGFVDIYDLKGTLLSRLISGGSLNSPWGLALAPANFGAFSNDLLVGNFGDGNIHAYDPTTGNLLGTMMNKTGKPIQIGDLWALTFGNGGSAGNTNELFFTAGVKDEIHGLFGKLVPGNSVQTVPLPAMVYVMPAVLLMAAGIGRRTKGGERVD